MKCIKRTGIDGTLKVVYDRFKQADSFIYPIEEAAEMEK